MPKVAEAAVLAYGNIIHVEESKDFDTKAVDGVRVLVATGDGFASVKLNIERTQQLKPQNGQPVAWFLRFGASGGNDRAASAYASFVRVAEVNDLDRLAGFIKK